MNPLQNEVDALRRRCIGCGKCTKVCPSFKHGGCDPMEIMIGNDEAVTQRITCGNCSRACRRTDPFRVMQDLLCLAKGIHLSEAFRKTGYSMPLPEGPGALEPEWRGDDAYVMPGCVVKCKVPYVEYAAAVCMGAVGVDSMELPGNTCCMHPLQFREMPDVERYGYKNAMGKAAKGKDLVTLCAGCSEELEESGIEAEHIIPFLERRLDALPRFKNPLKVALEPGCSAMRFKNEMKAVAEAMGCEVVNSSMGCCGKYSPVSEALMDERESECASADVAVVGCPMCLVRYESREGGVPAVHIAELVAMAVGDRRTLPFHNNKPADGSWEGFDKKT